MTTTHETPVASQRSARASAGVRSSQKIPALPSNPEVALDLLSRHADKIEFNKGGCWNWTACTAGALNYGNLWCPVEGRMVRAHRAFYEAFCGAIPDGLVLCHACDNPKCCNPLHMFTGTQKENIGDMISKGRARFQRRKQRATNISRSGNGFYLNIQRDGKKKTGSHETFCKAVKARTEFINSTTKTG